MDRQVSVIHADILLGIHLHHAIQKFVLARGVINGCLICSHSITSPSSVPQEAEQVARCFSFVARSFRQYTMQRMEENVRMR